MGVNAFASFDPGQIETLGSTMHYFAGGVGRPLLFLHGSPTSSYLWRNVAPSLAKSGRCIAVDLIGMGQSGKPAIEYRYSDHVRYLDAFCDSMGLTDCVLVTHGWGAALGVDRARRVPGFAQKIVLIEPIRAFRAWEDFPPLAAESFRAFRSADRGREMVIDRNLFIEEVLPKTILRSLSADEMEGYRAPFRQRADRMPLHRFACEVPIAGEPADVAERLSANEKWLVDNLCPKLLLYARPGANMPPKDALAYAAGLGNCEAAFVGEALHQVPEDCPAAIAAAIAEWLAR